ncbi:Protoheme IX farnesyltransferase, mitochondrial [Araneus ventricosus]|uniref:Protoheme IX farnesyltransferase, mitochondrial n=1 Tax=Araneus ventricosus TaxID=182803 RepID=A0A4Y2WRD1_ARAVE|nr:Protoheme IX farnesyltransferase, mitochondrial [Araneus ventricosus]
MMICKFVSGAVLIGAIVYSWAFQRLNALPWILRSDYSRLGYCMAAVIDPAMCRRVALLHSVGPLILCSCAPFLDLTTWTFAFDSFPLNCYLIYRAWSFFKDGDNQSARKLVDFNLIYLPLLMFLMLVGKKYSS